MDVKILRECIKKRGLKQTWIAGQLGVHTATLNRYLTGKSLMDQDKIIKLLDLLGLELKVIDKRVS